MLILFLQYTMHHLKVDLVVFVRFLLKHKLFEIYQITPSQFKYS